MTDIPFFSIAIPFYSRNDYSLYQLKRCIKSIRNQSFKDFEIIISTQNSFKEIKSDIFFKGVSILDASKVKGFIQGNVNNAIKSCKGGWIKILFSDDFFYDHDGLKNLFNSINKNKNKWIVMNSIHVMQNTKRFFNPILGYYQKNILSINTIGSPSAIAFKNNKEGILFDLNTWMRLDVDFYQTLYNHYGHPAYAKNILIVNEIHEKQFSYILRNLNSETKDKLKKEINYLEKKFKYKFPNKYKFFVLKTYIVFERLLFKILFLFKNIALNLNHPK